MDDKNFSQQLEQVVSAALTDGFISEKERNVLYRLAESEGISRETVDKRLGERLQQWRTEKKARLHKCPQCGTELEAFVTRCPSCGAEIAVERASSVKELERKLAGLKSVGNSKADKTLRRDIISTFPVPNTREDLLEFLTMAADGSRLQGGVSATPVRRFLLVLGIFVGLFLLVFLYIYFTANETWQGESLVKRFLVAVGAAPIFGLITGAPFAFFYAAKGGSKANNLHNEFRQVWQDKFRQCMTKARLTLHSAQDVARLDELEQMIKK